VATALALVGHKVIITSRSAESGELAATAIRRDTGSDAVESMVVDLSNPSSVGALAGAVESRFDQLHVLSANAGIVSFDRSPAGYGCGLTTATNFVGHVHLISRLSGLLARSAPARVALVSGNGAIMRRLKIDLDHVFEPGHVGAVREALDAALLKTMFAFEFNRRFADSGVSAFSYHPGGVRSNLGGNFPWPLRTFAAAGNILLSRRSPTGEYVATAPELDGNPGGFYERSHAVALELRHSEDDQRRLWEMTEGLIRRVS